MLNQQAYMPVCIEQQMHMLVKHAVQNTHIACVDAQELQMHFKPGHLSSGRIP